MHHVCACVMTTKECHEPKSNIMINMVTMISYTKRLEKLLFSQVLESNFYWPLVGSLLEFASSSICHSGDPVLFFFGLTSCSWLKADSSIKGKNNQRHLKIIKLSGFSGEGERTSIESLQHGFPRSTTGDLISATIWITTSKLSLIAPGALVEVPLKQPRECDAPELNLARISRGVAKFESEGP